MPKCSSATSLTTNWQPRRKQDHCSGKNYPERVFVIAAFEAFAFTDTVFGRASRLKPQPNGRRTWIGVRTCRRIMCHLVHKALTYCLCICGQSWRYRAGRSSCFACTAWDTMVLQIYARHATNKIWICMNSENIGILRNSM